MAASKQGDNWSSAAYQNAAAFVPKLATKVVTWLDVQPEDKILDIGCGDGVLTNEIAQSLTTGHIHGIDSSPSMITTAASNAPSTATFAVVDATLLTQEQPLQQGTYTKVFSNAALHWILSDASRRKDVLTGAYNALQPSGTFVFEAGGHGNVAEMHVALLMATARRIGIAAARAVDPWFFADEAWIKRELEGIGFAVEKSELAYRATKATDGGSEGGGVEGWVRLMGKVFLDAVGKEKGEEEREACVREVVESLETVCGAPSGEVFFGYVRLRVVARKI